MAEISETLEFKTQIHKAWNSTEQRMALRKYPRRSISYDYYGMNPVQSQYLRAISYAKQNEKFEMPLWHAACSLSEDAVFSMSHVNVAPASLWHFRGCGGVMFWRNDIMGGDRYFLQYINSDGYLKLTEILEKGYSALTTTVCPVAYGYLKPESEYSLVTASLMSLQLNVELMDDFSATALPANLNENNFEVWGDKTPYINAFPTSYQGVSVFPLAPSWTGDLPAKFTRNANKLDNESGLVKFDLKSVYSSETKEIEYVLCTKSEINNFQRFFIRCMGRLKSFFAPTWLNDLMLAKDAPKGQSFLLVEWPAYWQYYAKTTRRKLAVVFYKNGTIEFLPLAGYSVDETGSLGKVYLEKPMGHTLAMSEVAMISYFCRYRFDSDSLTLDYDTTGIASTTVSFAEVNA